MGEHRVPMLGGTWRRSVLRRPADPQRSTDPRVVAVLAGLRAAGAEAPSFDDTARSELRAQLVAITARVVAEEPADAALDHGDATATRTASAARGRAVARHADRRRRFAPGRVLAVAGSLVVVLALVLVGGAALSRRAMPGDALYGLKRTGEHVQLAMAGSDRARAADHLHFAATRAAEARSLARRPSAAGRGVSAAGSTAHTDALLRSTLAAADSDVQAAARLLGQQAVRDGSPTALSTMTTWAPRQLQRLSGLSDALDGSMRERAERSMTLVRQAADRADQVGAAIHCRCASLTAHDALGPSPAPSGAATPSAPNPGSNRATSPAPAGPSRGSQPTTPPPSTSTGAGTGTGTGKGGTGSGSDASGGSAPDPTHRSGHQPPTLRLPSIPVPTLGPKPSRKPSAPVPATPSVSVSLSSCGATARVGQGGIRVGLCGGLSIGG